MSKNKYNVGNGLPFILTVLVSIFLIVPIIVIFLISLSSSRYLEFPPPSYTFVWYKIIFSGSAWIIPFINSVIVASITGLFSVLFGLFASLGFLHISGRWKKFFLIYFLSPLIMPVIIIAVSLFFFYSHLGLVETRTGLILSHIVITFPISFFVITNSLTSIDSKLENTAQVLGEKPFKSFARITLPLLKPSLITSFLLNFIISFDEPVIAIFIAGTRTITLPKKLWDGIKYEINPSIAAVSVILVLIVAIIILILRKLKKYNLNF